jgi:hypothetical protein
LSRPPQPLTSASTSAASATRDTAMASGAYQQRSHVPCYGGC